MFGAHGRLLRAAEEIARSVSRENGKALDDARGEVTRALEVVEFAAGMPRHLQGETLTDVAPGLDTETRRYPLGVLAAISPFNFPAMIPMWQAPIALAAGNAVILKPSEQTPLTAGLLADLLLDAGVPEGVLGVVHGAAEVVNALCDHEGVDAVSFVGSAPVARHVYKRAAGAGKRVQALAGAKNFMVVLDDAAFERTADAVFSSAFGNAGQRCLAGSVALVTRGVADRFVAALVERAGRAPVGPGLEERSVITPVIREAARQRIAATVARAREQGARVLAGDQADGVGGEGYFLAPVVVETDDPASEIACEEVFGPVLTVLRVDDLEEALEIANASRYGNAAAIFTGSGGAARTFRERIQAGMVGVNVGVPAPVGMFPFSGWKGSFYGDLHTNGMDGVRFCTRVKTVTTRWFD